ncbi:glyoxalase/Bleomycin resistance protein/Dioxygenase superfamily protein [Asticcacaulis biprosthecium C19]|uniref:Glyoxalase/Bleomycin resistance protein/Dioxygenase superfamily protein n=1 Tax=Asticcacaulis biprosthecium C19 TaxID=715226 RepID=F4QJ41_9CAUL|nr:VOC family protein [Asticcacaulis biprosthecium]EGF91872.1 glyoxalase/Bleomycin resistance protein/Dioxygenase superfamily protein [Asticcacaulis biprosthecium C19]
MRFLHTMVRVKNLEAALHFFCDGLGLRQVRRMDSEKGRFSLIFLSADEDAHMGATEGLRGQAEVELTYNWPDENGEVETYTGGRNFGHLAYEVDDVYAVCAHLQGMGVLINRPPRDGVMAFVRSPDGISVELLQKGDALPPAEPWVSMPNVGTW